MTTITSQFIKPLEHEIFTDVIGYKPYFAEIFNNCKQLQTILNDSNANKANLSDDHALTIVFGSYFIEAATARGAKLDNSDLVKEWHFNELGLLEVQGVSQDQIFNCTGGYSDIELNAVEFGLAVSLWAANDILWHPTIASEIKEYFNFIYHYANVLLSENYNQNPVVDVIKIRGLLD